MKVGERVTLSQVAFDRGRWPLNSPRYRGTIPWGRIQKISGNRPDAIYVIWERYLTPERYSEEDLERR